MKIAKFLDAALMYGRLSKNMDSYILDLEDGGSVCFTDHDGSVADAVASRPDGKSKDFGADVNGAISFAKAFK